MALKWRWLGFGWLQGPPRKKGSFQKTAGIKVSGSKVSMKVRSPPSPSPPQPPLSTPQSSDCLALLSPFARIFFLPASPVSGGKHAPLGGESGAMEWLCCAGAAGEHEAAVQGDAPAEQGADWQGPDRSAGPTVTRPNASIGTFPRDGVLTPWWSSFRWLSECEHLCAKGSSLSTETSCVIRTGRALRPSRQQAATSCRRRHRQRTHRTSRRRRRHRFQAAAAVVLTIAMTTPHPPFPTFA